MTMPFYSHRAPAPLSAVLVSEAEYGQSREAVTILAGAGADRTLALGTVLGKRLFGAPVIAAKAGGNTGDGALGTLSRGDACKAGIYTVTCIAAAADGGRFQVVDPDGYRLADALVGVAFASPQLGFTIADGAVDFVVGDGFTVTIPAGDGKVLGLTPAATDGSQLAHGILVEAAVAPDGTDAVADAVIENATVIEAALVWPAGISDQAKAAALTRLRHDFVRTAVSA
ncbi:MAG: head decoration protein [Alphaproteobacteria bacterium]|nr:head decoration protein [Alphaproteobacteria bacterium]